MDTYTFMLVSVYPVRLVDRDRSVVVKTLENLCDYSSEVLLGLPRGLLRR